MNKCVICGKMYEPYRNGQKTCSAECRKEMMRREAREYWHAHKDEMHEKQRKRARAKHNGRTKCMICGEPIIRTWIYGEGKPRTHTECVIKDCIKTINAGKYLDHTQSQRLYRIGYTIGEFMEEYRDEITAGR